MTPGDELNAMDADKLSRPGAFHNTAILASAGSGKTYQLALRYIGLLVTGAPAERILATTFTRKAAGEILGRVLSWIAEAADDAQKSDDLAEILGIERDYDWLGLLGKLTGNLHRLAIGTLDSFFAGLTKCFDLELGLPPGWRMVEVDDIVSLRLEAIHDVLAIDPHNAVTLVRRLSKGDVSRSVTSQLDEIIASLRGILCESEKDAWHRLPHLTEMTDAELAAGIARLEAAPLPDKQTGPFQKSRQANVELAKAGKWLEFPAAGLAKSFCAASDEPTYSKVPFPPELAAAYRTLVDHARAVNVNRLANQTEATHDLLVLIDREFRRHMRESKSLSFDDVTLALCEGGFENLRQTAAHRLDGVPDFVLLDEFQDTSRSQWQVLAPMVAEAAQKPGGFFCVGDRKQAIYSWRGGMAELFDVLDQSAPNLKPASLATSFRSAPAIIDAVNRLFQNLGDNAVIQRLFDQESVADVYSGVQRWIKDFPKHSTARKELAGRFELRAGSTPGPDEDKEERLFADVCDLVVQLRSENPTETVAVLVRKNKHVALTIELLAERNIAASEEGGVHIHEDIAVAACLSLLRLADHPGDTIAWEHVRQTPLAPFLVDPTNPQSAIAAARGIRRELMRDGYGPTLRRWASHPAFRDALDSRKRTRIQQLLALADGYESRATLRPGDFVAYIEGKKIEDPLFAQVRVMTVHKAKGLEFDTVVLPTLGHHLISTPKHVVIERRGVAGPIETVCRYANEAVQPLLLDKFRSMYRAHRDRSLIESLNVLYVGMTRAKLRLVAVIPPNEKVPKEPPATIAGLLQYGLLGESVVEPNQVLFAIVDPPGVSGMSSLRSEEVSTASDGATASMSAAVPKLDIPAPTGPRSRGLIRQSPSSLEGGTRVDLKFRMRLDNAEALNRGSAIHALFSAVEWFDNAALDDAILTPLIVPEIANARQAVEYIGEFRAMLAKPTIAQALVRSRYKSGTAQVWRERPFAIRLDDTLLTGAFDRVVIQFDGDRATAAEILDFKTDAPSQAELDAGESIARFVDGRTEMYRPQMNAYRKAICRIVGLEPTQIRTTLAFVTLGQLREV